MRRLRRIIAMSLIGIGTVGLLFSPAVAEATGVSSSYEYEEDAFDESSGEVVNDIYDASTITYDAANFSCFKGRTAAEVAEKYSNVYYNTGTYSDSNSTSYYSVQASTKSPYNKGTLTTDTHNAMNNAVNFYRWLVGVNEFTSSNMSSPTAATASRMQAEALDRNFEFNHSISNSSKPSDMDDATWQEGFTCTHNILASGSTPQGAIRNWLNEGYTLSSSSWRSDGYYIGHRAALIGGNITGVQFGYCGRIAVGKDTGSSGTHKNAFSAFPSQGYFPNRVISPNGSAWDINLDTTKVKYKNLSDVKVIVTNVRTGESYECTSANDKLRSTSFYGTYLVFVQPGDYTGSYYTDSYKVEVTGLTDSTGSSSVVLKYQVDFFDPADYSYSPVTSVSTDITSVYVTVGTNEEQLKSIAKLLPTTVNLTSQWGKKATVNLAGGWTVDTANKCFVNYVNSSVLPSTMKDTLGKLKRITIAYSENNSTGEMSFTPSAVKPGASTKIKTRHNYSTSGTTIVYKIGTNYSVTEKYNTASSAEYDSAAAAQYYYHYFNLSNMTTADAGDYFYTFRINSGNILYVGPVVSFEVRSNGYAETLSGPYTKVNVSGTMLEDTEALTEIGKVLPKEVYVTSDIGDTVLVPVSGSWTVDTVNQCFINTVTAKDLAKVTSNITDKNSVLGEVTMPYAEFSRITNKNIKGEFTDSTVKVGNSVTYEAVISYSSDYNTYDTHKVYKYNSSKDTPVLVFDSQYEGDAYTVTKTSNARLKFELSDSKETDSGYYFDLISSSTQDEKNRTLCVTKSSEKLSVKSVGTVVSQYGLVASLYISNEADSAYISEAAKALPRKGIIVTDIEDKFEVDCTGAWTYDEENGLFINQIDAAKLPTNVVLPSDYSSNQISMKVLTTSTNPNYYKIYASSSKARIGGSIVIYLNRFYTSYKKTWLCTEGKAYTNTDSEFDEEASSSSSYDYYTLSNITYDDAGTYYSLAYDDNGNISYRVGYLSKEPFQLAVSETANVTSANSRYTMLYMPYVFISNETRMKQIACMLPTDVTVSTDTGESFLVKADGNWIYDKSKYKFTNTVSEGLPEEVLDPNGKLNMSISCSTISSSYYNLAASAEKNDYHSTISITGTYSSSGSNVYRPVVYKYNLDDNGKILYEKKFDSRENADSYDDTNRVSYFSIKDAKASDSGEYISIWDNEKTSVGYISKDVLNISVEHTNIVTDSSVAAGCLTTGLTEGKHCKDCGDIIISQTIVNALGHKPKTLSKVEATCTKSGLTEGSVCERCQKTLVSQTVIKALGHNETADKRVEPTCTESGLTAGSHCERCKEILVKQNVIPQLGHDYSSYKIYWGNVDIDGNPVSSNGTESEDEYSAASIIFTCQNDNCHKYKLDAVPAKKVTDSTCSSNGEIEYTVSFSAFGKTYPDKKVITLPKKIHNVQFDVEWNKSKDSESKGYDEYTSCDYKVVCKDCKKTLYEGNEKVTVKQSVSSTCVKQGYIKYAINLNYNNTGDETDETLLAQVAAKNEVYADMKTVNLPLDMNNHPSEKVAKDAYVAPDCINKGKTEGSHCEACNNVIVAQNDINALGHDWGDPIYTWNDDYTAATAEFTCKNNIIHTDEVNCDVTVKSMKAATCDEDGEIVYELSKYKHVNNSQEKEYGGETKTQVLYKLGHEFSATFNWNGDYSACTAELTCINEEGHVISNLLCEVSVQEDTVATCVNTGRKAVFASVTYADKKYSDLYEENIEIDSNNHEDVRSIEKIEPTCTSEGMTAGSKCYACDIYIVEPVKIDKTAHDYSKKTVSDDTLKSNANFKSPAVYYYSCVDCGAVDKSEEAETFTDGEKLSGANVYYTTHVQSYGWQGNLNDFHTWKYNGLMAGTSGEAKRLEGIKIMVESDSDIGIEYRTHIQTYGWEKTYKRDGEMSGTTGEAKRLEAISIRLTGADKDKYDIYYRVHAQTYGWLGWAKNGQNAGTAAQAKRLEGIEIVILPKGEVPTVGTVGYSYIELGTSSTNGPLDGMVNYMTHIQTIGNQKYVYDGSISGALNAGKRIEGLRINLNNEKIGYEGDIYYQTQVQTYGWLGWTKNGDYNGTSGMSKRVEAIRIKLSGEVALHYDVYYRIYSEGYGWLGWAKNGEDAGTVGLAKRLEGLQVVLVPKGQDKPSYLPGSANRPACVK